MLWETELKTLAERKQALAAESDLLRAELQVRWQGMAHQLRWVDRLQRWTGAIRPVLMFGASFLGFRRTSLRGRLLRVLGAGLAIARTLRHWVRRSRPR